MTRRKKNYFALVIALLFSTTALLFSQNAAETASELARTAESPYNIERFVKSHSSYDWEPLWKALKITDKTFMPDCNEERHCSAELIEIFNPPQTIVLLRHESSGIEFYLRYLREAEQGELTRWRFAGYFNPFAKYFELTHKIMTLGDRPYLVATEQGIAGLGLSSEIESWRDLTRPDFKPVLSYAKKGHYWSSDDWFMRDFEAVNISLQEEPTPSVTIIYDLDFTSDSYRLTPHGDLGHRSDKVEYSRNREGEFAVDEKRSTLSSMGVRLLYGDDGPSCEDFLRYDFTALKKIAAGGEYKEQQWLKQFLSGCEETIEKKQLTKLLQAASSTVNRKR